MRMMNSSASILYRQSICCCVKNTHIVSLFDAVEVEGDDNAMYPIHGRDKFENESNKVYYKFKIEERLAWPNKLKKKVD